MSLFLVGPPGACHRGPAPGVTTDPMRAAPLPDHQVTAGALMVTRSSTVSKHSRYGLLVEYERHFQDSTLSNQLQQRNGIASLCSQ